jgi:hypothetical protein
MKKTRNPRVFWASERYRKYLSPQVTKGFRVNARIRKQLARRKRRIQKRPDKNDLGGCSQPMFTARNVQYEISERGRGIAYGGIGAAGPEPPSGSRHLKAISLRLMTPLQ